MKAAQRAISAASQQVAKLKSASGASVVPVPSLAVYPHALPAIASANTRLHVKDPLTGNLTTDLGAAAGNLTTDLGAAAIEGASSLPGFESQNDTQRIMSLRNFSSAIMVKYQNSSAAFNAFDTNGDGAISNSEFTVYASSCYEGDTIPVFEALDSDAGGDISMKEFAFLDEVNEQERDAQARMGLIRDFSLVIVDNYGSASAGFQVFDVHGDGAIDRSEFAVYAKNLYEGDISSLFSALDVDNNGRISSGEFSCLDEAYMEAEKARKSSLRDFASSIVKNYGSAPVAFGALDKNSDGSIAKSEFAMHANSLYDGNATTIFSTLDEDGSGDLSLKEVSMLDQIDAERREEDFRKTLLSEFSLAVVAEYGSVAAASQAFGIIGRCAMSSSDFVVHAKSFYDGNATAVFSALDDNSNGNVSASEFSNLDRFYRDQQEEARLVLLRNFSAVLFAEYRNATVAFRTFNLHGGETIDSSEFALYVRSLYGSPAVPMTGFGNATVAFNAFQKDGGDTMDSSELAIYTNNLFRALDQDNSGDLSIKEFSVLDGLHTEQQNASVTRSALLNGVPPLAPGRCIEDCSSHGSCDKVSQVCECIGGWTGEACDVQPCPSACHQRGTCVMGTCVCNVAFYGASCEHTRCLNDCSGNGDCNNGKCACYAGFRGESCHEKVVVRPAPALDPSVPTKRSGLRSALATFHGQKPPECPENCNGNGQCEAGGMCRCFAGYKGVACQDFCPNLCSGNGECTDGRCLCLAGFGGADCSVQQCCSGHGDCNIPDECVCAPGWVGDQCQIAMACPDPDCSSHGMCTQGRCECQGGWGGISCATPPPECGLCPAHGRCNRMTGVCMCGSAPCANQGTEAATTGDIAHRLEGAALRRPEASSNNESGSGGGDAGSSSGVSISIDRAGANTSSDWYYSASSSSGGTETSDASGVFRGGKQRQAISGGGGGKQRQVVSGGGGWQPQQPDCNSPHGAWDAASRKCLCKGSYYGSNCEHSHCSDWNEELGHPDCSNHGMCVYEQCLCSQGWGLAKGRPGPNVCADMVCPIDCGEHGMCREGVCVCQEGWQGPACREPKCANDCSGRGVCAFAGSAPHAPAQCMCDFGYSPPDCAVQALYVKLPSCVNDCSGRGLCMNGRCVCSEGFDSVDCSRRTCPTGTMGPSCEFNECPRDCSGRGLCLNGECACDNEHMGPDCSIPTQCYESCGSTCLADLAGARCEFCKGHCLTMGNHGLGRHYPLLERLSTVDISPIDRSTRRDLKMSALAVAGGEGSKSGGRGDGRDLKMKEGKASVIRASRALLQASSATGRIQRAWRHSQGQRLRRGRHHVEVSVVQLGSRLLQRESRHRVE